MRLINIAAGVAVATLLARRPALLHSALVVALAVIWSILVSAPGQMGNTTRAR